MRRFPSESRSHCGRPEREAQTEYFYLANQTDLKIAVVRTQQLGMLGGASDIDRSVIATIVSELGSNIIKYSRKGAIRIRRLDQDDSFDIDIQADDRGPGIPDIALAMQEHYSSSGTLGLGLSGVQRMADAFWIESALDGGGTTVFARKRIGDQVLKTLPASTPTATKSSASNWDAHTRVRSHPAYARCGDAALVIVCEGGVLLSSIDATGHGSRAASVADQAVALIREQAGPDLVRLMAGLHSCLKSSPGAAVGLLFVDTREARFHYLGVGNSRSALIGARRWRGVSRDGVVGDRLPSPFLQAGTLDPGDILMLWTDGLPEFQSVRLAESLTFRSAAVMTQRLLDDLARSHDDASCLVFKWQK